MERECAKTNNKTVYVKNCARKNDEKQSPHGFYITVKRHGAKSSKRSGIAALGMRGNEDMIERVWEEQISNERCLRELQKGLLNETRENNCKETAHDVF